MVSMGLGRRVGVVVAKGLRGSMFRLPMCGASGGITAGLEALDRLDPSLLIKSMRGCRPCDRVDADDCEWNESRERKIGFSMEGVVGEVNAAIICDGEASCDCRLNQGYSKVECLFVGWSWE